MEFLSEYGMFLAQAITIVVAIVIVIAAIANAGQKTRKHLDGHIEINNLSEELEDVRDGLQKELLSEEEYKALAKEKKKQDKLEQKENKKKAKQLSKQKATEPKTNEKAETAESEEAATEESDQQESDDKSKIYVLDFDGDVEASAVESLREEITAIVSVAAAGDKVLLRLESPGGLVHAYGLAASQLMRLKDAKLELIIAVDQVAASGGYMMACVADQIIAAPFAVVGSIGVVAEIPNFHRLLRHNKVDYEQHTAGDYKRTLTMFAENTEAGRKKFQEELEETHVLFQEFITENRPKLDIKKVATGEHWYGSQALDLGLIDKIQTSDDYIVSVAKESEVFEISYRMKKPFSERFTFSFQTALEKALLGVWRKSLESRLFK